jgi:hypothetical protein
MAEDASLFRPTFVIPAKAGIQIAAFRAVEAWIPACAGTTKVGSAAKIAAIGG